MAAFERITPRLYCFQDICNVYAVVDGERALLVDFGTGAVLDHLHEIGVRHVDAVLHTHHHRDQCQGDEELNRRSIPIVVPAREATFFEEAEVYWRRRQLFDIYDVTNTFHTRVSSVIVERRLADYEVFSWRGIELLALPTPGHTKGHLTYLAEIDGERVAFTGDLIHSPGHVWTLHDLQWQYGMPDGISATLGSIRLLRGRRPQRLLPSHGHPMPNALEALDQLDRGLRRLFDLLAELRASRLFFIWPNAGDNRITRLSRRLFANSVTVANFYTVMAEEGRALLFDYGFSSWDHFGADWRFSEHSLRELEEVAGMRQAELLIPSHYHDDHIAGVPFLRQRYGTRVWAYENMVDILEHPSAHNLPCLLPEPIPVERSLADGESFTWEGIEFTAFHMPGHTWYANGIAAEIDGRRVALTGDNLLRGAISPLRPGAPIYRNRMEADSIARGVARLIEFEPEVILTGHSGALEVTRAGLDAFYRWALELAEVFRIVVPNPQESGFALDPTWATIYPFQNQAAPGETLRLEVRLRNYHSHQATARVSLDLPAGWQATPAVQEATIAAGAEARLSFAVTIPRDASPVVRQAITATVALGELNFGPVTEALVTVRAPQQAAVV